MFNESFKMAVLELQNESLRNKVDELQKQIDEMSDSYELELEVSGVIIRTDVKHLEEVMTKLYELSRKLN
jgi:hypothetical protein